MLDHLWLDSNRDEMANSKDGGFVGSTEQVRASLQPSNSTRLRERALSPQALLACLSYPYALGS